MIFISVWPLELLLLSKIVFLLKMNSVTICLQSSVTKISNVLKNSMNQLFKEFYLINQVKISSWNYLSFRNKFSIFQHNLTKSDVFVENII